MKDISHRYHADPEQGSYKTYWLGFLLSVALTLAAYFSVEAHLFSRTAVLGLIFGFGFLQVIVQMILFLHLGHEKKPHWNFLTFSFMLAVLLILVFGSLWIMWTLDYNVMSMPEMK
ncbi:MAG: cytochrome o ubiquinol oxidase subunit IV [Verrucomicrobiota bacterium]|nr:cytochrome o ubiquinol oxidase subunit IV [Verrucomicrobiota bacterium]